MVRSSSRKESAAKAAVAALTLLLALGFGLFATAQEKPLAKNEHVAREGGEREEKDTARKRIEWFYQQRAFPLGFIPAGARLRALQELDRMLEREGKLVRQPDGSVQQFIQPVTTMWSPIGPQPTVGTFFFGNTSGRVTALAVDPTNPNIVYLGGAEGGVWKSTNGGTNWTPLTDSQPSLAVGSIVIDPNNPNTIYVGTGEENFAIDSYYGAGILKSTDGGATWTQLGSGTFFNTGGAPISARSGGARIGDLAISNDGTTLLAAVQGAGSVASGVYRSPDRGQTWTSVLSGAPGTTVLFDPSNNSIAYAALGFILGGPSGASNGVYKSTNGGQTWAPANGTGANVLPSGAAVGRIEIAIAPSSPSTLYASIQDPRSATFGALLGFFKTIDGGVNWTALTAPDYCNAQCWYDNAVRVKPDDAQTVFAGGSAVGFTAGGYLIRSTNGGNSWSGVAVGGGGVRLHVDHHALAFSKPGSGTLTLYAGNDGGVWSTADILGVPVGTIRSRLHRARLELRELLRAADE